MKFNIIIFSVYKYNQFIILKKKRNKLINIL